MSPYFFALQPILSLYAANSEEAALGSTLVPAALTLAITLCAMLLLTRLTHNRAKASVIVSVFWLLFFSFGHVTTSLLGYAWNPILLASLWFTAMGGLLIYLAHRKGSYVATARFFSVVGFVALLIPLLSLAHSIQLQGSVSTSIVTKQASKDTPNIFFIVTDEYTRSDSLQKYLGYDNTPHLDYLKKKGFFIAEHSTSNYHLTMMSLSSALNMNYVDELLARNKLPNSVSSVLELIQNNATVAALREHGYTIASISTQDYSELRDPDTQLELENPNEFAELLWDSTPLSPFVPQIQENKHSLRRQKILDGFEMLKHLAKAEEPTFVFAHFMAPHLPFLFDAQGNPIPIIHPKTLNKKQYIAGYRDSVTFINSKVQEAVDTILSDGNRPAIIIIIGDHGARREDLYDSADDALAQLTNMTAYYFPDKDYNTVPPDVTPVNLFRIVLNKAIGTAYPLLKNRNFTGKQAGKFVDVTKRVDRTVR